VNLITSKLNAFMGALSIVALAALSGCGYSGADLCDDTCDCSGCSDNEYDDCLDTADDLERSVENEGCEDQYDEYLSCLGDEFRCVNSVVDLDGCSSESSSLNNCLF
jgi:hypothetical protein